MLFKKNPSLKERANAAIANLTRNAYAMGMLRSRLESKINFALNEKGNADGRTELLRVLELVKNGELILHEMSEKIESARYLEEFVMIMDSAAASVSDIKTDLEQMVPATEAALEEMHDAISKVSLGLPAELRQEIDPGIMAEIASAMTTRNSIEPKSIEANQQRVPAEPVEEGEPEPVPA